MRRLLLLAVLVACKSKSEPAAEEKAQPVRGGPGGPTGGVSAGSGERDRGLPDPPKPTAQTSGPPRTKVAATEPAPATPTPAKPDDAIKPAEPQNERPAPDDFGEIRGGGPAPLGGQRLPPGTIGFTSITALDPSTLDAGDAGSKIKTAYQAGLLRCYLVHLSTHAAAKGTAQVTFTVGADGKVAASSATSFAPELDACLAKVAGVWRFRIPTDPKTTQPASVRFAVGLAFQPG